MSDLSPYVPGDAPGLLGRWRGPVEDQDIDGVWHRAVTTGHSINGCPEVIDLDTPHRGFVGASLLRLDLRIPEARDRVVRWLAGVLGVPVGATAPLFYFDTSINACVLVWHDGVRTLSAAFYARDGAWSDVHSYHPGGGPALASIPLDHPDRDALALAAVARWAADEIRAGRLPVKE